MNSSDYFSDIIGHKRVISSLKSSWIQNRFPHSVLFSGPEGIGKKTIALNFSRMILSHGQQNADNISKRIEHRTHPDLIFIDLEWGVKNPTSFIKIEAVRQLERRLKSGSYESNSLVIIIDPAEQMTRGAANALLKTLEEPPDGVFFFLIAVSPHRLPITIRSRCQSYRFSPLSENDIFTSLSRSFSEKKPEDLQKIAEISGGRISRALKYLTSQDYNGLISMADQATETVLNGSLVSILNLADKLSHQDRELLSQFLSLFEINLLKTGKERQFKGKPVRNFDTVKWLALLRQSKYDLEGNINKGLIFEHLFLEMRRR
ncbi:MAG: DNA polymerase III subunit [Deltaproteobacteria bacterium]|jgi:DNA polymerase-3 subunit delta'|nr:DNA polymerase III subunit [Deltaproteobacteria bacterium]